ncbi:MAG: aldo/keto reductase [SAR202 cluster bacterium]|nr:aldo/keto reductase [SAR202 cluster bacterium]
MWPGEWTASTPSSRACKTTATRCAATPPPSVLSATKRRTSRPPAPTASTFSWPRENLLKSPSRKAYMQYNPLGRTGLNVSRVGFGGGGIGQVWGATTREEAVKAVHRALDLGINYFDVAPAYGDGKAEEALGIALEGRSEGVIIGTKVRVPANNLADATGAVQRSMETSLRLLKRDSVDILHVHNRFTENRGDVPNSLSADDVMGPVLKAYQAVQQAGKTRFIGLSAMDHHVPTLKTIMESGDWDTVLAYYNLLNWTAQLPPPPGAALFDNGQNILLAKKHNMGVIGIRSHAAGALTSGVDRPVPPDNDLLRQDVASAAQLGFLLDGNIKTLSQAATVFCLMNEDIHTTVPGVKNQAETEEMAGCIDLASFSEAQMTRLKELYFKGFRY